MMVAMGGPRSCPYSQGLRVLPVARRVVADHELLVPALLLLLAFVLGRTRANFVAVVVTVSRPRRHRDRDSVGVGRVAWRDVANCNLVVGLARANLVTVGFVRRPF